MRIYLCISIRFQLNVLKLVLHTFLKSNKDRNLIFEKEPAMEFFLSINFEIFKKKSSSDEVENNNT